MADAAPSHWILIAVLFSSQPLTPSITRLLHRAAYELYRADGSETQLEEALVRGRVANLRREWLVGTMGGPAFEAEIDTERGHCVVRFVLTHQGIGLTAEREPRERMN